MRLMPVKMNIDDIFLTDIRNYLLHTSNNPFLIEDNGEKINEINASIKATSIKSKINIIYI